MDGAQLNANGTAHTFAVSRFPCLSNPNGAAELLDWRQLCEKLTTCDERPEKDGPLISPTIYKDGPIYRKSENVEALSALVADCDESHTLAEIRAIIKATGARAVVYSTHSNGTPDTEKHPDAHAPGERYRVFFPLETPVSVADYPEIWERFNLLFGGEMDAACKDAARAYWLPSHPTGAGFIGEVFKGHLLRASDLPELPNDFHTPQYTPASGDGNGTGRPGDDFNARATNDDTAALLESHGWRVTRSTSHRWKAKRPGKNNPGISATIGHYGPGVLHVFTSNAAPFEAGRAYKPFGVLALLDFGGDFKEAARDLAKRGFGDKSNAVPNRAKVSSGTKKGAESGTGNHEETNEENQPNEAKKSQADLLLEIAMNEAEIYRNDRGEVLAAVAQDGKTVTLRLRSMAFRSWLNWRHFETTGRVASSKGAADAAISVLDGQAHRAQQREVFTRIAATENAIYYDLADEQGRTVEITANGWRLIERAPVAFIRPKGMLAQVAPERGGSVELLRDLINVHTKDFPLVLAWCVGVFQLRGPRPHLAIIAEQGSGKSLQTKYLRQLIDPNAAPTRSTPKEARDLMIGAKGNAVLAFDNLSHIPVWFSDFLCRLATGAGYGTRSLYENDEEEIFALQRPVIFNAITDVATRPDLLDRTILLELPRVPEEKRKDEQDLNALFERHAPLILGALFDAVATGLKNLADTHPENLPRMADFARWVTACAPSLGMTAKDFANAYKSNRETVRDLIAEISTVLQVLEEWLATQLANINGTIYNNKATHLLASLNRVADFETLKAPDWPKGSHALGRALKRLAPVLRSRGYNVESSKVEGNRAIKISIIEPESKRNGPKRP